MTRFLRARPDNLGTSWSDGMRPGSAGARARSGQRLGQHPDQRTRGAPARPGPRVARREHRSNGPDPPAARAAGGDAALLTASATGRSPRPLEPVGLQELVIAEDRAGEPVRHDAAVVHHDRPGEHLVDQPHVVRGHQQRLRQPLEHADQLPPPARIEAGRRLVEHEHLGVHRQDRRQGNALPLAEAQAMRHPPLEARHAYRLERPLDAAVDLGLRHPHVQRPERHVLEHGRAEQLVVGVLEHEAHLGPDPAHRRAVDHGVADADRPMGRSLMPLRCSINVLLPAPFGPTSATFSPAPIVRSSPFSASNPSG